MKVCKKYRISGHESFPVRFAWISKVVRLLQDNSIILTDDDKVMVELGLGKNMVRSARFWAQTSGVINLSRNDVTLTTFGDVVFGNKGYDPYLEDIRTLWLIHWQLSTDINTPMLAWEYLLSKWNEPEMIPSVVIKRLHTEASKFMDSISEASIQQHLGVFFHTYIATRNKKGEILEDNLDCPLIELEFIRKTGERESPNSKGGRESVYAFRNEDKPDITPELFSFCVADYWAKRFPNEQTLSFRDIAHGPGSPGRVFKIPESAIKTRLENIDNVSLRSFYYSESAQFQLLRKTSNPICLKDFLGNIYTREASYV